MRAGTGVARRRRGKRRAGAIACDAYELFLDAICDTMGSVMFIMLMVVLFGRAVVPVLLDPRASSELKEVRDQRDDLQNQIAALPPAGDPAVQERWKESTARIKENTQKLDEMQRQVVQRMAEFAARTPELQASDQSLAALRTQLAKIVADNSAPASAFVRISRFRTDARPSAVLTLNGGKVSRMVVTHQTKTIAPPTAGEPIADSASARAALATLLADAPPATHRVELIVWEDSFPQAKLIEQALVEMGYDTNPLPVVAGQVIKSGTGGVQ